MGFLTKLKPSTIRPSQDFLKKKTMDFIFNCYKRGALQELPPPPLVRQDPRHEGRFIAIDGHNLLAAHEFFGTECVVFLVDSANDYLPNPEGNPAISQRNKDLSEKFESCVDEAERIGSSFRTLIKGYTIA